MLGAGAEMGPLPALLRWGATGGRGRPAPPGALGRGCWRPPGAGAGRLLVPTAAARGDRRTAGVDLVAEVPAVADWLAGQPGRLVLGNYVYADGAATCGCPPPSTC